MFRYIKLNINSCFSVIFISFLERPYRYYFHYAPDYRPADNIQRQSYHLCFCLFCFIFEISKRFCRFVVFVRFISF